MPEYALLYGAKRAMVLTAGIYAVMHFEPSAFVPQFTIGLLTAYLVYQTKSLLPGIAAHIVNNIFGLLIQQYNTQFAERLISSAIPIAAGALIIFAGTVVLFSKYNMQPAKQ